MAKIWFLCQAWELSVFFLVFFGFFFFFMPPFCISLQLTCGKRCGSCLQSGTLIHTLKVVWRWYAVWFATWHLIGRWNFGLLHFRWDCRTHLWLWPTKQEWRREILRKKCIIWMLATDKLLTLAMAAWIRCRHTENFVLCVDCVFQSQLLFH